MSSKNLIQTFGFVIILVFVFVISVIDLDFNAKSTSIIFTFAINGIIWLFLMLRCIKKYPYSLQFMHWIFCLMFFFISPLIQYLRDDFVYQKYTYFNDSLVVRTNILLLLWTLCVFAGVRFIDKYKIKYRKKSEKSYGSNRLLYSAIDYNKTDKLLLILSVISVLITLYRISQVGFWGLLSHATSGINYSESGITSLVNSLMRGTVYFSASFSALCFKYTKKHFYVIVNVICLLISYFPTGTSRFIAAAIYIGLLLTCSDNLKCNRVFAIIMLISLFVIWPFFNSFRRTAFLDVNFVESMSNTIKSIPTFWCDGDFDAYSITMCVEKHIQINGNSALHQLLGVFLFFIPRGIWPNKPIGSGAYVAENMGFLSTNVSAPLPAEGLINMGITGLIVLGFIVGCFIKKVDQLYWGIIINKNNNNTVYSVELIYPVVMTLFFLMSRGDLLSSYSHIVSFVLIWFVISKFMPKREGFNYERVFS